MKRETKKTINDNGSYTIKETIETKPDDGFVHEADIHDVPIDNYGKFSKGYSKTHTFVTNDPRITRPFVYGFCGLFFLIGIINWISGSWFFGIIFILSAILTFSKAKKDIDEIEEELKKKNGNEDFNSKENKEKVRKEFSENINNSLKDTKK